MKITLKKRYAKGLAVAAFSRTGRCMMTPKKQTRTPFQSALRSTLMKLNLIASLLVIGLLQVHGNSYGQNIKIKRQNASFEGILKEMEKQSGYMFFYKKAEVSTVKNLQVDFNNTPFKTALNELLKDNNFEYDFFDQAVVIKKSEKSNTSEPTVVKQQRILGRVMDKDGKGISGASIRMKSDPQAATSSGEDGDFSLPVTASNKTFIVSYVGYGTVEFVADPKKEPIKVVLVKTDQELEAIVVSTGLVTRNKESFTGATASFTGAELKQVGNTNVIQTLKTLDPSFILMENNLMGSNPNGLPQIEIRGKTSIPGQSMNDLYGMDPNQPLFILNGFETTLRTVVDLDINRILSVTILKDAASTAMYGARASNGVIVIQTIRPTPGPLRITYNNDMNFEVPDLSVYNMMNAAEKLEFERLAGRYHTSNLTWKLTLDELYNKHLTDVMRGVDTYWLKEPLRDFGFTNNSSIYVDGGAEAFSYGASFNYKRQNGVMKESNRDSWTGTVSLIYKKDNFTFDNETFIRGYQGQESPYGAFSTWVNTNPYFEKNTTDPFLERAINSQNSYVYTLNPMYEASLYSYDRNKNVEIQNNMRFTYKINDRFNWITGLQVMKGFTTSELFRDPRSNDFVNVIETQKGTYRQGKVDNDSYNFNTMLTYNHIIAQLHSITANFRVEAAQRKSGSFVTDLEGFPIGSDGNPRYAYSYKNNSSPSAAKNTYRTLNGLFAVNYAYNSRYLFDFSYRVDGSTAYGSENQYSPFWSTGIGWNLHQEDFLKEHPWINKLKLSANVGITGNQNYGSVSSFRTYDYGSNSYYNSFGNTIALSSIGFPDLKPQATKQYNFAADFSLFNKRFNAWVNYYIKDTDPLVVSSNRPSSTGVPRSPINAGNLVVKGIEARVDYTIKQNEDRSFVWKVNATANHYKDQYRNFGGALAALNGEEALNKTLIRYADGNSSTAIWAKKSMGIDPLTGREVFFTGEGQYTFDPTKAEVMNVGNTIPNFESVFSTSVYYKGFNFGVYFRWRNGADIFNTALYDKVENISFTNIVRNQDKRALYDRWKNPGDIASFVSIRQTNSLSDPSSRFVQRENVLSGESLNFGYTFSQQAWLQALKVKSLNVTGYLNEFFRASTVLRERGISYPFARSGSLSIRASF